MPVINRRARRGGVDGGDAVHAVVVGNGQGRVRPRRNISEVQISIRYQGRKHRHHRRPIRLSGVVVQSPARTLRLALQRINCGRKPSNPPRQRCFRTRIIFTVFQYLQIFTVPAISAVLLTQWKRNFYVFASNSGSYPLPSGSCCISQET